MYNPVTGMFSADGYKSKQQWTDYKTNRDHAGNALKQWPELRIELGALDMWAWNACYITVSFIEL